MSLQEIRKLREKIDDLDLTKDELDLTKDELVEIFEWMFELVDNAETLVKKLDVILPKVNGIIGLQSLRAGGQQIYEGPDPTLNIEAIRVLLELEKPAATARDFWPEDYCRTCEGTGKVMPGEGRLPQQAILAMALCVRAVPDRAAAYRLMRGLDRHLTAAQALALLDAMEEGTPIPVLREGQSWHETAEVHAWQEIGAEFIYQRRIVWPCYDICPDCGGTANRDVIPDEPFEFNSLWPEAPVDLLLHERQVDGEMQSMSREELERLFRVFMRDDETHGDEGGLAI